MTDQEKIDAIITALQTDTPTSNTGKVLKAVLIQTIPTVPSEKLDQIMAVLELE